VRTGNPPFWKLAVMASILLLVATGAWVATHTNPLVTGILVK
jgi:hypothetical protein